MSVGMSVGTQPSVRRLAAIVRFARLAGVRLALDGRPFHELLSQIDLGPSVQLAGEGR
jgi:hypothetical protein